MMGGLKSPTMNRQDRQTRNAIKRNPSPNETRPHTLGIGPKPQNARIAKSKATAVHNILKNISRLPLMLRDDRRPHRSLRAIDWRLMQHGEEPSPRSATALIGIKGDPAHRSKLSFLARTVKTNAALLPSTLARDRPNVSPVEVGAQQ